MFLAFLIVIILISSCDLSQPRKQSRDFNLSEDSEYFFILGDIQEYTINDSMMSYYDKTISWISSQREYYDINAIIYTGDITESNEIYQWQNYYQHTASLADDLTVISCIGNHDYKWDDHNKITSRDSTHYTNYTRLLASQANIVSFYEKNRMENIIVKIEVNGIEFNIIILEFGPRKSVIEWANDFLSRHVTAKNIILTHEYLTRTGELVTSNITSEFQFSDVFGTPLEIWKQLVAPHNVLCVLCGHNGFHSVSFRENIRGVKVAQVLFNLQYQKNGGNGYIQIWEFPKNKREVYMTVYDTVNREYMIKKAYLFSY